MSVTRTLTEAGFRYPTAITDDLYARLTPNEREKEMGQSYESRLWDVVYLADLAAKRLGTEDRGSFKVELFETEVSFPHQFRRYSRPD